MKMKNIKIIGSYITQFGELWDKSLESLFAEAVFGSLRSVQDTKDLTQDVAENVIKNINVTENNLDKKTVSNSRFKAEQIDAVFVANMASGQFANQLHLNALVSQMLPHNPPAFRVEAACASGGMALELAELSLLSGKYKTVLVVGAEKMTDVFSGEASQILSGASEYQKEYGSTFPALYALFAQAHMKEFGTTRAQLSAVASKNHTHALSNPKAQFRKEIPEAVISKSSMIADPLRLFDCSPVSDGAAAVILTTKNLKKYAHKPVIAGVGHAQDTLNLAERKTVLELSATVQAAQQAYQQAGITPQDIMFAEVHDCFTIAEILATEDLGFFEKGTGGSAVAEGRTTYQKKTDQFSVVINPSGGLKACGHPVGATGVKQVAFLAQLLEATATKNADAQNIEQTTNQKTNGNIHQNTVIGSQKKKQKKLHGLTHNVGGSGATAIVHIISQEYIQSI